MRSLNKDSSASVCWLPGPPDERRLTLRSTSLQGLCEKYIMLSRTSARGCRHGTHYIMIDLRQFW